MSSSWLRLDDNDVPDPINELRDPHQAKQDFLNYLREEVFVLNFYRVHMLYFVVVIATSSVVVYGEGITNGPRRVGDAHLTYIDAVFLTCSVMTTTGMCGIL